MRLVLKNNNQNNNKKFSILKTTMNKNNKFNKQLYNYLIKIKINLQLKNITQQK